MTAKFQEDLKRAIEDVIDRHRLPLSVVTYDGFTARRSDDWSVYTVQLENTMKPR